MPEKATSETKKGTLTAGLGTLFSDLTKSEPDLKTSLTDLTKSMTDLGTLLPDLLKSESNLPKSEADLGTLTINNGLNCFHDGKRNFPGGFSRVRHRVLGFKPGLAQRRDRASWRLRGKAQFPS